MEQVITVGDVATFVGILALVGLGIVALGALLYFIGQGWNH